MRVLVSVSILVVAIVLRLIDLEARVPHFDEGVDGYLAGQITWSAGYHPQSAWNHGPLHFYLIRGSELLFGRSVWSLRLPAVLFSILTVLQCLYFRRFLGSASSLLAAAILAVSPAFVFYGRYAIHESELTFFLLLFIWSCFGWNQEGNGKYVWSGMVGIAGCLATKETSVLHFAAMGIAAAAVLLRSQTPAQGFYTLRASLPKRGVAFRASATAAGLLLLLYTGHFTRWDALGQSLVNAFGWAEAADHQVGHAKPWFYWFELLYSYEWPLVLGVVSSGLVLWKAKSPLLRFLGIYNLVILAIYTLLPYKTSWCLISISVAFPFLIGPAIELIKAPIFRLIAISFVVLSIIVSGAVGVDLNFRRYADPSEEYVYSQTSPEVGGLIAIFKTLLQADPSASSIRGKVLHSSSHPVPWLLQDFFYVDYFEHGRIPPTYDSGFLLVEPSRIQEVEANQRREYYKISIQILDGTEPSALYLRKEFFGSVLGGYEGQSGK